MGIQLHLPIPGILERPLPPRQISFAHWPRPMKDRSKTNKNQLFLQFRIRNNRIAAFKRHFFHGKEFVPCCYCEKPLSFRQATIEHILQSSKGGRTRLGNLAISCAPCNNERQDYTFEEWKKIIQSGTNKTSYLRFYKFLRKRGRLVERKYLA